MKRCSISLKKMICEVLAWLNGPMGVRVILLLLWLLSVIFVADYTSRKTIELIDLTELRTLNPAPMNRWWRGE